MSKLIANSLEYFHEGSRLQGYFCRPQDVAGKCPGVVLVHDAFGVGDFMQGIAERLAQLGYAVLAADVWGDGVQLREESEIGPMIGRFASDRKSWMGRLQAAQQTLAAQAGVDATRIAMVGYCFGGASVLEYLRTVGGVRGVVSLHGGLDLVGQDWRATPAGGQALLLTGFEDPMAGSTRLLALQQQMSEAGVAWEVTSYGHTRHGFTRPDSDRANKPAVIAYHARSDRRAWIAMRQFLEEILGH